MVYGYARCSTNEQKQDINRQKRELRTMGVTDEVNMYWEYESGTKENRPEFQKLLEKVTSGDIICTTEVSRLTRSTKQLCEIIKLVKSKKICLKIGQSFTVDCRSDDLDPMTKGMIMMWGVFSEMERDIISQRVKSGMINARAKGAKIGRPEITVNDIPKKFIDCYKMYKKGDITISDIAKLMECSRTTVYKYISIVENQKEAK